MTKQPEWICLAQLGDINPLDYGGYWVFSDKTGVYPPEGEWLEVLSEDNEKYEEKYTAKVYRFPMDKCTYVNDILSDNKYHPELSCWWMDELDKLSSTTRIRDIKSSSEGKCTYVHFLIDNRG